MQFLVQRNIEEASGRSVTTNNERRGESSYTKDGYSLSEQQNPSYIKCKLTRRGSLELGRRSFLELLSSNQLDKER
ncbi:hypothetical protein CDAR_505671 [Caerostris darwini]|uniref:Uncharacterized protein n=1 Tax=Caerostris darwini TaxID=1538125 RepID=A0AAV4PXT6_9ARAC|nr:hypothetical protein CDAR_505671 [Caerostris darwini]